MGVEYRKVVGFPSYRVSDTGIIVRICKKFDKVLWGHVDDEGYKHVTLCQDRKSYDHLVHRLVLETFVGPYHVGKECRHRDGNPLNNRLDNLEWATHLENMRDTIKHGTVPCGERSGMAKTTKEKVIEIRKLYASGNYVQRQLSSMFDLDRSTVGRIVRRERWSHV